MEFSAHAYFQTGRLLSENFHHIFATLEGGYNISTLRPLVDSFIAGINGEEIHITEPMTESRILSFQDYEATAARIERKLKEAREGNSP